MLKKTYLLSALAAFLLVFSSCDKDKEDDPEPSLEERISNREWRLTAQTVKVGNQQPENILPAILDHFNVQNVSVELDGEGEYVVTADGDTQEGSYEIEDDEISWDYPGTYTYLSSEDEVHTYTVELDGNTMRLISNTEFEGEDAVETITFRAN